MESKKLIIDFSSKPNIHKKKKVDMEKERKKRVITTTDKWIKNELTTEEELDMIRELKISESVVTEEHSTPKPIETQKPLILQQLNYKMNGYRSQDVEKDKYCEEKFVTVQNILDLLISCDNICYYCKEPVKIFYDFVREPKQWSLDRIDNDFGHNYDNVIIACLQCNLRRKTMYHERYLFTKQLVITKTG